MIKASGTQRAVARVALPGSHPRSIAPATHAATPHIVPGVSTPSYLVPRDRATTFVAAGRSILSIGGRLVQPNPANAFQVAVDQSVLPPNVKLCLGQQLASDLLPATRTHSPSRTRLGALFACIEHLAGAPPYFGRCARARGIRADANVRRPASQSALILVPRRVVATPELVRPETLQRLKPPSLATIENPPAYLPIRLLARTILTRKA
jgi:hypothetical protein